MYFISILSTPHIRVKANQVNIDNDSCTTIALISKGNETSNSQININIQNQRKVIIIKVSFFVKNVNIKSVLIINNNFKLKDIGAISQTVIHK